MLASFHLICSPPLPSPQEISAFHTDHIAGCVLCSQEAAEVFGRQKVGDGGSLFLRFSEENTQCDQMGFLFWMKALIPSCPSFRATLSTMVWEVRW